MKPGYKWLLMFVFLFCYSQTYSSTWLFILVGVMFCRLTVFPKGLRNVCHPSSQCRKIMQQECITKRKKLYFAEKLWQAVHRGKTSARLIVRIEVDRSGSFITVKCGVPFALFRSNKNIQIYALSEKQSIFFHRNNKLYARKFFYFGLT